MNRDMTDQQKAQQEFDNAPRCSICGTKKGFAWGTGDCGCGTDYESPQFDQW